MWSAHTIFVDGKLFTWKGHLIDLRSCGLQQAYWTGSLESKYFPSFKAKIDPKVTMHHGIFESCQEYEQWLASLEVHPGCPVPYAIEEMTQKRTDEVIKPLKYAIFEVVVQETQASELYPSIKYWRCKDNIQHLPWIEV